MLDLSLPYESFLLGPFDLKICCVWQNPAHNEQSQPHAHLVCHDQLVPLLPAHSSMMGVIFQKHLILWRWHGSASKPQGSALGLPHGTCHEHHIASLSTTTTFNCIGNSVHMAGAAGLLALEWRPAAEPFLLWVSLRAVNLHIIQYMGQSRIPKWGIHCLQSQKRPTRCCTFLGCGESCQVQ